METLDRLSPGLHPLRPVIGYQRWDALLFLHWSVDPEQLRPLLPERLSVDTFEGRAYVSLTAFTVEGARLRLLPALPKVASFHELNVRTYVHLHGRDPGIWFFSLDASSPAAAAMARVSLRLPYYFARITREVRDGELRFESERRPPAIAPARFEARWKVFGDPRFAEPGTLEHFLVERYFFYSKAVAGTLWSGQVHHRPWSLRSIEKLHLDHNLDRADRLPLLKGEPSAQFSAGVDVEFFSPTLV